MYLYGPASLERSGLGPRRSNGCVFVSRGGGANAVGTIVFCFEDLGKGDARPSHRQPAYPSVAVRNPRARKSVSQS
jgi:hypothetical protein